MFFDAVDYLWMAIWILNLQKKRREFILVPLSDNGVIVFTISRKNLLMFKKNKFCIKS